MQSIVNEVNVLKRKIQGSSTDGIVHFNVITGSQIKSKTV